MTGQARGLPAAIRRVNPYRIPEYGLLAALTVLVVAAAVSTQRFAAGENVLLILEQSATTLIVAAPFAVLMLAGHIDLSVGANLGLCAVVGSIVLADRANPLPGILLVLAVSTGVGLLNGVLCTRLGFAPIIVTLGMLGALRGLAFVVQGTDFRGDFARSFLFLGQGRFRLLDIPLPVAVAAAVFLVAVLALYRLRIGRHVQAVGANPRAAFLAGINADRAVLLVYLATGFAVGIAALVTLSKLNSGPATTAIDFEIAVLTAVLLGGVAFGGGRGSLVGVLLGVLFIKVLSNACTQWGLSTDAVRVIQGGVLVAAAGLQATAGRLVALAARAGAAAGRPVAGTPAQPARPETTEQASGSATGGAADTGSPAAGRPAGGRPAGGQPGAGTSETGTSETGTSGTVGAR